MTLELDGTKQQNTEQAAGPGVDSLENSAVAIARLEAAYTTARKRRLRNNYSMTLVWIYFLSIVLVLVP